MSDLVIDADVGVVGAGPGGMAAATRLAAAGLSVAVLDEAPGAPRVLELRAPRADCLDPENRGRHNPRRDMPHLFPVEEELRRRCEAKKIRESPVKKTKKKKR